MTGVVRVRKCVSILNEKLELYLLVSLYVFIILAINLEVIRRYVIDASTIWGHEAARFMYIYLTWIGVSWGVKKRIHIRIDILHQYVSERTKGLIYVFSGFGLLILSVYSIRWTLPVITTALEFGSTTPGLRLSRAYFVAAIPIAFTLTIVRTLQWIYKDIRNLYNGRPLDEGAVLFRTN